ncbi:MAG: hypothetical protein R8J85_08785 [Mariprofundales bacterium]
MSLSEKKKEDERWNRRKSDLPVRMYVVIAIVLFVMGYFLGGAFK